MRPRGWKTTSRRFIHCSRFFERTRITSTRFESTWIGKTGGSDADPTNACLSAARLARQRLRFLKLEYAPTIVLILAIAQMDSFADQGVFWPSYSVAGF